MIIVFGASGFLGSNIANYFASEGYPVLAVVRPQSDVTNIIESSNLVIKRLNPTEWPDLILEFNAQHVICAQWDGVSAISRTDSDLQSENIDPQVLLATMCLQAKSVETFTSFGSQAEISPSPGCIDESSEAFPQNEYGQAKAQLYSSLSRIFENQDIRFLWFRVFSIFGAGNRKDALIPKLIASLMSNKKFHLKNPALDWSLLPIEDLSKALDYSIFKSQLEGITNIGNPVMTKLEKICEIATSRLEEISGMKLRHLIEFSEIADQKIAYHPDTTKIESIGWKASDDISMQIKASVDWEFKNRLI